MANTRTPELSVGIGQRVAELRRAQHVTAESVAEAARALGMKWERILVTFLETGRRGITAEELVMLPSIMSRALGRDVTIDDLLPQEALCSLVGT